MITVTRRARRAVVAVAGLALATALTGCGSNNFSIPRTSAAPSLPPAPATTPADYTTLPQLLAQLVDVAQCTANGPGSAVCDLTVTTTNTQQIALIRPFQVKVFTTTAGASQYLTIVRETNATRASTDSAPFAALVGPHWVVTPQTTTAGLVATLRTYLGGSIVD